MASDRDLHFPQEDVYEIIYLPFLSALFDSENGL